MKGLNLENQRFGRLIVIKRLQGSKWLCHCDCGNEKVVLAKNLIQGKTLSCGCLRKQSVRLDITGLRFGMLVAIEPTDLIKDNSVVWRFKCDCGNDCNATLYSVKWIGRKSCGCLSHEVHSLYAYKAHPNVNYDGVNVGKISSKKLNKNNKSGHKGVCWSKQYQKWEASLKFKSKKYHLGLYDKLEDAVKARAKGEEHIFDPFLEWYAEYTTQNNKE